MGAADGVRARASHATTTRGLNIRDIDPSESQDVQRACDILAGSRVRCGPIPRARRARGHRSAMSLPRPGWVARAVRPDSVPLLRDGDIAARCPYRKSLLQAVEG